MFEGTLSRSRYLYFIRTVLFMAYRISSECIACGACKDACPADCIAEGDKYSIKEDACLSCGACADACPTGCISEK
jgi:MinD superfamily P-loop ATPase